MKNARLIIAISPLLLLFACSKTDDTELIDEKTYPIEISVAGQDDTSAEISAKAPALKSLINQLTIVAYTEDGYEYARRTQLSTDPSFGKFTLELPQQFFNIIAIGSKSTFGLNQFYQSGTTNPILLPLKSASMQYWQPTEHMTSKVYKTADTFYGTLSLPVTSDANFDLTLQRIVGKLEVKVDDVDKYIVDINNEATGFMLNTRTAFGTIDGEAGYEIDNSKGPVSIYILRTDKPLNIEIRGGGMSKELQVPVFKNQRTIVSGKLLAPPSALGLNVTINDKWLTDTTFVKF